MTLDQIEKICDKEGFWVNKDDNMYGRGKLGWEIGQMSSCGEDWFETFEADDVDTFIANLESRIDNWDSEEEALPYIEMRGQSGVPSSIRDLLDDADWKLDQLKDLLDAIKEAPDEEDEIEESKKQEGYIIKIDKDGVDGYWGPQSDAINNNNNVDKLSARIFKSRGAAQREINRYKHEMGNAQIEEIEESKKVTSDELDAVKWEFGFNNKEAKEYIKNNQDKIGTIVKGYLNNAKKNFYDENKKVTEAPEDEIDVDKLADEVEPTKLDEIITEWEAKSPLHERIIEEIIDDSEGYDGDKLAQIKGRLGDISYGLVNGTVGSLIYYDDTNKFFEEYYDDIWDVVQEWSEQGVEPLEALKRNCDEVEIIMGTDNFKCWVVWMVYEEIAYLFGEALDEINSEEQVSA